VQEYIRIFPSKFNYNKKLLLINTIVLLSFYKNKRIKKKYSIFLLGRRRFYIITQPLANLLVLEYI
jgi:Ca2+/Na+ antiporter